MNQQIRTVEYTSTNPRRHQLDIKLDTICKKLEGFKELESTLPTASNSTANSNQQSVLKKQYSMIKEDMAAAKNDLAGMKKTKDDETSKAEFGRLDDRVASVEARVKAAKPRSVSKLRFVPSLPSY